MRTLDCVEVNIFDVVKDENSGDIADTKLYMLNDRGRELVRNRNLKTSKSVENSDRIDTLENEIKNVKESVNNLRYQIEKIKEFDSELSEAMESAVNEHEERLAYIESVIDENN
jgi:predicted  nucleic acid-binding Zn-ribbon protein